MTSNKAFYITFALFAVFTTVSPLADLLFPGIKQVDSGILILSSQSAKFTLATLAFSFLTISLLIFAALFRQKNKNLASKKYFLPRLIIGSIFLIGSIGLFAGTVYIFSKQIVITDEYILQKSLAGTKKLRWSDILSVNGNFVPGSRLGLRGNKNYAWVKFSTIDRGTVHFSLRFMRDIQKIEDVIGENFNITWANYIHPEAGYSLRYPKRWKVTLTEVFKRSNVEYGSVYIKSPNFKLARPYPALEEGASFFIDVEETEKASIDKLFAEDPLAQHIAVNKHYVDVDGEEAIQYDYCYETHHATMTQFVKDGDYYTIQYRYVNKESKDQYWREYEMLLDSFKAPLTRYVDPDKRSCR